MECNPRGLSHVPRGWKRKKVSFVRVSSSLALFWSFLFRDPLFHWFVRLCARVCVWDVPSMCVCGVGRVRMLLCNVCVQCVCVFGLQWCGSLSFLRCNDLRIRCVCGVCVYALLASVWWAMRFSRVFVTRGPLLLPGEGSVSVFYTLALAVRGDTSNRVPIYCTIGNVVSYDVFVVSKHRNHPIYRRSRGICVKHALSSARNR